MHERALALCISHTTTKHRANQLMFTRVYKQITPSLPLLAWMTRKWQTVAAALIGHITWQQPRCPLVKEIFSADTHTVQGVGVGAILALLRVHSLSVDGDKHLSSSAAESGRLKGSFIASCCLQGSHQPLTTNRHPPLTTTKCNRHQPPAATNRQPLPTANHCPILFLWCCVLPMS